MKKTLITSLIAVLAFVATAFAETPAKSDLPASAQGSTKEIAPEVKPVVLTKKQKTEADLRGTSQRLKVVISRTQTLIDLLSKKEKATEDAQTALDNANLALEEANSAIDQFAGIFPPVTPTTDISDEKIKTKEIVILKDPLKKAQESLRSAKTSLLESIASLKDLLVQKESSE